MLWLYVPGNIQDGVPRLKITWFQCRHVVDATNMEGFKRSQQDTTRQDYVTWKPGRQDRIYMKSTGRDNTGQYGILCLVMSRYWWDPVLKHVWNAEPIFAVWNTGSWVDSLIGTGRDKIRSISFNMERDRTGSWSFPILPRSTDWTAAIPSMLGWIPIWLQIVV